MFDKILTVPNQFYAEDGRRLSPLAYLFLIMLCVAFFTPGFATMPPTDRDESSFAQASKQMIESGNYTDIRLEDAPRYKKPIGIYWLQSTAVRILNPQHMNQIWAYRVPSLLAAVIVVLLTASIGEVLFTPQAGLIAAMMMAGCVLLNVEARLAKTDASLLACIMAAMYAMARVYKGDLSRWKLPLIFWTAIAAGVLIKGPIILLPICGTLLWLKISDKNIAWFRMLRPVAGVLYALVLIAPWFVAITMQSHGAFMTQSAGQDMFAKLWRGQNRGGLPPGAYLATLPVFFFPFALFTFLALPDMWKGRRELAIKFCLGWIVPTWLVFEISMTKLPHYILPIYPALALLTAHFLIEGLPSVAATTRRLPVALIVGIWLVTGTGFALAFTLLPVFSDNKWSMLQIIAGAMLILTLGWSLFLLPRQKMASVVALTVGSLIFLTVVFGSTIPGLQHVWMSRQIVEAVMPLKPCPDSAIVSAGYHEPSLAFMAGTNTIMATDGVAAATALKADACRVAIVDSKHQKEFLDAFAGDAQQPRESGMIEGLNTGHGARTAMTVYLLPKAP